MVPLSVRTPAKSSEEAERFSTTVELPGVSAKSDGIVQLEHAIEILRRNVERQRALVKEQQDALTSLLKIPRIKHPPDAQADETTNLELTIGWIVGVFPYRKSQHYAGECFRRNRHGSF